MKAIETKMLSKSYGDICAVSELCLEVSEGELFALLGVNGAGKTTTIKMLSGLTEPTSGSFSVFGHSRIEDIKSLINVSPQETAVARRKEKSRDDAQGDVHGGDSKPPCKNALRRLAASLIHRNGAHIRAEAPVFRRADLRA